MRRFMAVFVSTLTLMAITGPVSAAKVEADPNKEYVITPDAGVWMILAGSFRGPDAKNLAHQLVIQLRDRDKLPAWVFNFSEEKKRERQEYLDELHRRAPDLPQKTIHIEDEYGVLVGGYKDSEAAHDVLLKIKKLPAPDLKLPGGKPAYEIMYQYNPKTQQTEAGWVNPLTKAFVTRNPTIPLAKRDPNAFDPLWTKLNEDETYSLLKNKHAWTLVVKDFEGVSFIQTRSEGSSNSFLKMLGMDDKNGETLNAAALNAHNLAEMLHNCKFNGKQIDAYVLHTRHGSVVTIGGFDSLDDKEFKYMQIEIAKGQLAVKSSKDAYKAGTPADLGKLQLMSPPMPMKVPRPDK